MSIEPNKAIFENRVEAGRRLAEPSGKTMPA